MFSTSDGQFTSSIEKIQIKSVTLNTILMPPSHLTLAKTQSIS
jgi:hypothetical protein